MVAIPHGPGTVAGVTSVFLTKRVVPSAANGGPAQCEVEEAWEPRIEVFSTQRDEPLSPDHPGRGDPCLAGGAGGMRAGGVAHRQREAPARALAIGERGDDL